MRNLPDLMVMVMMMMIIFNDDDGGDHGDGVDHGDDDDAIDFHFLGPQMAPDGPSIS